MQGQDFLKYGGATSCVVVRAEGRDIVFDAGSGLATYGHEVLSAYLRDRAPIYTCILISHSHLDHLIGLPYYTPLFLEDARVDVYGPRDPYHESFAATIDSFVTPPFFPVPRFEMKSDSRVGDFAEGEVLYFVKGQLEPIKARPGRPSEQESLPDPELVEVEVHCMRGYNHPKCGVNFYKVIAGERSIVYATDTEGYVHGDQRLMEFARGADVLIHDAMYTDERYKAMPATTQGYGHSTVEIATQLAQEAGIGRLFLFHHAPTAHDDELDALGALGKSLYEPTEVARDGLHVELI